jgi:CheY-like chemotaxis protein
VLLNRRPFTPDEFEITKQHAVIGARGARTDAGTHEADPANQKGVLVWPKMRATPIVLVVDDEEPIRIAVRRILEGDGYHVIEAENGAKAVTLLEADRTVHVLLTDLEMPELTGEEMVRQLREKRPDLRVLYVTGHVDRLFSERPVLREGEAFVEKPFTSKGLLEAISLLLYRTFKRPK